MLSQNRFLAFLFLTVCTLGAHAAAQQVKLSATSLTFGSHTPGNSSAPQTITLSNDGAADLTVGAIAASGGFAQSNDCATLHPGQSCTIDVTYISSIVGNSEGVLTINDNAASTPEIVTLTGTVLPPITLALGTLSFGSIAVGTSQTKSVTITNNGSAFGIAAISTSGDYAQANNCPAILPSGKACTVNVTFRPRANGTRAGVLAIASKDAGFAESLSGFTAALSGRGAGGTSAARVSLQPAALNFAAKTPLDLSQRTQTVKLTNTSASTSLTVQNVSTLGPIYNGTEFYQIASTDCRGMLAPGGECNIKVVQNPATNGFAPANAAGSLMIVDSDGSSPNVIPLATRIQPELQFSPASLNFTTQAVGTTSAAKVVTVTNRMDLSGISLLPLSVSGDFNIVSAGTNPCSLKPAFNPGTSCTLGVTFAPNKAGAISGAISFTMYPECDPESVIIQHKACANAQVINLTGTGN
jgi:hypothetical protein